ncbi:MAG: hypothetical protein ACI32N_07580 [Bulleidia sp.]
MELKAIEHLIETDEKTCERIRKHHAERKQLKEEAEQIKQKMRKEVAEDTAAIIADTKQKLDEKIENESRANSAYYEAAAADLKQTFEAHRKEWCIKLVDRITGETK